MEGPSSSGQDDGHLGAVELTAAMKTTAVRNPAGIPDCFLSVVHSGDYACFETAELSFSQSSSSFSNISFVRPL